MCDIPQPEIDREFTEIFTAVFDDYERDQHWLAFHAMNLVKSCPTTTQSIEGDLVVFNEFTAAWRRVFRVSEEMRLDQEFNYEILKEPRL